MLLPNLTNFYKAIVKDRFLLLILALGLMLRSSNPTFGSPSLFVSNDEAIAHLSALNMLANKTPFSIANYTPFGAYAQIPFIIFTFVLMTIIGTVKSISDFELLLLTNEGYLLFIPRLISAFFGTLLIIVSYKLTLALFNKKSVALTGALLTAVSFNLVHISNSGRPWSAALFFMTLSVYLSLKKKSVLAILSLMAGFGFHQVSILYLPLLFLLQKKQGIKFIFKTYILLPLMIPLLLLSGSTNLIESIKNNQSFILEGRFLSDIIVGEQDIVTSFGRTISHNLSLYFLSNLLFTDFIILIFSIIGIFIAYKKHINSRPLVIYILLFFIFASLSFHPLIRYQLPILIIAIPFSALSISLIFKNKLFLISILIISSVNAFYWNLTYFKKPTFILAKEWVEENLSKSDLLIYTGGRYNTFVPDQKSLAIMQKSNKNYYNRLSSIDPSNRRNGQTIIFSNLVPGRTKSEQIESLAINDKVYYVIDYYYHENNRLLKEASNNWILIKEINPTKSGNEKNMAEALFDASSNFDTFDARKVESMYSLKRTGPAFDILKIKP